MDKTLANIESDLASFRANAIKYRRLAEDRRAADYPEIAAKLMELVDVLDAKAAQLETLLRSRAAGR